MSKRKLFVGNLAYSIRERDLLELFSRFGEVVSVNVLEQRGYGFVEMSTIESAQKAREALSEKEFFGRRLLIDGVIPFIPSERRAAAKRKKQNGPGQKGTWKSKPGDQGKSRMGSNTTPATTWSHQKSESDTLREREKSTKRGSTGGHRTRASPERKERAHRPWASSSRSPSGEREKKSGGGQQRSGNRPPKTGETSKKQEKPKRFWPLETARKKKKNT